jgi:T1SS-143 domain-containing protein
MSNAFNSPRGLVVSIWGKASIRGADGKWRALKVGEIVRSSDALLTEQDSIVMMTDGYGQLLPSGSVALNETDRVIAALDSADTQAATAAGLAGGGGGGLLPGLRVDRIAEAVTPVTLAAALDAASLGFGRATQSNPAPELANPVAVSASSSSIAALEDGAGIALGLSAPSGGGVLQVTVTQVPAIGQIVTAAGTPVLAGSTLAPADLPGLRYLPPADYDGRTPIAPFTYSVSNGTSTATGGTQITVTAVNDAPLANAGAASGNEDGTLAVALTGSDVDGSIASIRVSALPSNGVLLLADGVTAVTAGQVLTPAQAASLVFRPAADFNGNASVTFTVTDNSGAVSSPAVFALAVNPVNDPPVAVADNVSTVGTAPATVAVLANDRDVDGNPLSVTGASVNAALGSVVVNANGSLTFTAAPGVSGAVPITYSISDGQGGSASATLTVNVALAPSVTVDAPALSNDNTPRISGTSNLPPGSTVTLSVTDSSGAVQSFTAIVQPDGSYAADVPAPLAEGPYSVSATATAPGGGSATANDGGSIDTLAPALTVDAPALGNDATPTITGTTDLPPGSTITLTVTDANGAVQTFSATVQAGGVFSADVPAALAQGPYTVVATGSDPAGNVASASDNGALDTTPPLLTVDAPALGNDTTPTITGTTDLPAGSTITLTVTDALGAVQTFNATVQPGGTYSADVPTALAQGNYSVAASASDAAGNTASAADTGALDTTPPTLTVNAPALTNDTTPTITGSTDLPAGSTITLTVTDALGAVQTFNATVQPGGTYSASVPNAMAPGNYGVAATASDAAGNPANASDNGNINTAAPSLTVDAPALGNDATPTITGTTSLPPGSTVTLTVTDANGTAQTFNATVQAGGVYSADVPIALAEGTYSVVANASDTAGNAASANDSGAIDVTPPALAITLDANITPDDVINAAEAGGNVNITGSVGGDAQPGDTVTITVNGVAYSGTVAAGNTFSIAVPGSGLVADADKLIEASITKTDAAGNSATATDTEAYAVDVTPPVPTITLDASITADDVINAAEAGGNVNVTGSVGGDAKVGDIVTITVNGVAYTGAVAAGLTFSIAVPGSGLVADADKVIDASITTTDAAGNNASATDTESYTVDVTPPAATITIDAVTADNIVNAGEASGNITLTGTVGGDVKVGDTVTLTLNGTAYTGLVLAGNTFSIAVLGSDVLADADRRVDGAVTTTDAAGNSTTANATRNYAVNTAPLAVADIASVGEDAANVGGDATPGTVGQDSDADGDPLSVIGVAAGAQPSASGNVATGVAGTWGTLTLNGDGSYTYVPAAAAQSLDAGETVSDIFTYSISDGRGGSATATITVSVVGADDPTTIAGTLSGTVQEDASTSATGTLSATDPDVGTRNFSAQTNTAGTYGTFSIGTTGTWTYTLTNAAANVQALAQGQSVTETFVVSADDGTTASVTVTVNGSNDAPVVSSTSINSVEEGAPVGLGLTLPTDVDAGAALVITVTGLPTIGQVQLADGTPVLNGATLSAAQLAGLRYLPPADYDGLAAVGSFGYSVSDGIVSVNGGTTITLAAVNDPPLATNASAGTGENAVLIASVPVATDVDGTIASYALVAGPGAGNGALTFNGDGTYSFNPGADFDNLAVGATRQVTFTYTATDNNGGASAPATVTITVTGTNDLPIASNAAASTGENTVLAASVPAATDVDGTIASYALVSGPGAGNGALTFNGDGTYSFNPGADFDSLAVGATRQVTFTYTATDNNGGVSAPATVTITVTGTNDLPAATNASASTGENTVLASSVPAATDVDGTIASYALVAGPGAGNGALTFNSDGTYSFNPGTDFDNLAVGATRQVTFTYTATDNNGGVSNTASVTITVTGTNDLPVVTNASASTGENTVLAASVPVATDVDGTIASYALVTGPGAGNGALTFNGDGTYSFNPGADFDTLAVGATRQVTFTYTATDNNGGVSAPATVTITITGTNDLPITSNAAASTDENTVLASSVPAATDVDGTIASYALATGPGAGNGALTFNSDGTYSFNPGTDFDTLAVGATRQVTFTYTATDNNGGVSAPATVTITVTGTNDLPAATNASASTGENTVLASSVPAATDVDGTIASYALVTGPGAGNGALTFNGDGTYSFNPGTDFDTLAVGATRQITFTYTATDNNGGVSAPATVTITVTGTNDLPAATNASAGTGENTVLASSVPAATDVDGTIASYALVAGPGAGNGALTFNSDGTYSFNPGADFDTLAVGATRQVTFTYTATDNNGGVSAPATVTITVTGTNDLPVATNASASTGENTVLASSVPAATDVDGTIASYALVTGPGAGNGSLSFNSDGTYSFNPGPDFDNLAVGATRQVTFTYTATDNNGGVSAPATVTITVTGTNDAPVANADGASTPINTPLTNINVLGNDTDPDAGAVLSITGASVSNPLLGTVSVNPDGTLNFTPAANVTGPVTITYTLSDGTATSTGTLTVNIGVNTPPTGVDASFTVDEDTSRGFSAADFGFSDADASQTLLAVRIDTLPAAGLLTLNGVAITAGQTIAAGDLPNLVFAPAANANGTPYASFTFSVQDSAGGFDTAPNTITFNVNAVADPAVIGGSAAGAASEDGTLTAVGALTVTDPDAGQAAFNPQSNVGGNYGSFSLASDGAWTYNLNNPSNAVQSLALGQIVTDTFTVTTIDGSSQVVTITITGTNDVPLVSAASASTGENTVLASSVPAATDIDGTIVSYALVAGPGAGNGALTFNSDGTYSFNPGTDFDTLAVGATRQVTFTYTATDNNGGVSAPATVTITVTGTNDLPIASNAAASTGENTVLASSVPAATDVDGTIASYALVTGPGAGNGALTFNGDGTYSFNPGTDFDTLAVGATRQITFTYTATDNNGGVSAPATVTITVTGTNDLPAATNASAGTGENTVLASSVPVATDVDGTIASYALVTGPGAGNGALTFNSDGTYSFNPGTDFDTLAVGATRQVTFTYTATDNNGGVSAPATVTITVTGTNDLPIASNASASTGENTVLASSVPVATDIDGTIASYSLVAGPGAGNGALTFNSDGTYSFNPGADFDTLAVGATRQITFTYTATDNNGGVSAPATVTVTVTGTNDLPIASNASASTGENTVLAASAPAATDIDGTIASYALVTGPGAGNGALTFNGDGTFSFNPGTDFDNLAVGATRQVAFTYTATDNDGGVGAPATVTITVTGTNDLPIASNAAASTGENAVLASSVPAATDVDGTIANYALVAGPGAGNGSLTFNNDGTYSFNPGTDFDTLAVGATRQVTFTYNATDNNGGVSAPATVTITVTGTNDLPLATNASAGTGENAVLNASVPAATDVDGTIASYVLVAGPGAGNGSLSFNSDGSYSFNPGADFDSLAAGATRQVTFTYTATDNNGGVSNTATVTITVTGTNDAPVANADTASTPINSAISNINVLANDTDADTGAVLSVLGATVNPALGSVTVNPDGTLNFTPAANVTGPVTISYTLSDGTATTTGTLTVNVGANTPPTGTDASITLNEDTTRGFSAADFGFADIDLGQTLLAVRIDSPPAAGTLRLNGVDVTAGQLIAAADLGNLVFTPAANANGTPYASFNFSVQDSAGGFDAAPNTITLNVTPVADPAVIGGDTAGATTEDGTLVAAGALTVVDPDAGQAAFNPQSNSAGTYGSFSVTSTGAWTYNLTNASPAVQALAQGQIVTDTFTVTTIDGSSQLVTITITGTNDVPLVSAASAGTDENTVLASSVPVATDIDGTVASYQLVSGPAQGTLGFNSDGSYSFNPGTAFDDLAAGATRNVTFTYTATDNNGGVSAPATLTITVTGTDDAPVISADTGAVIEDTLPTTTGTLTATDVDNPALAFVAGNVSGSYGALTVNAAGAWSYTLGAAAQGLKAGQVVSDVLTVTLNDGSTTTVTITVTGSNDSPLAVNDGTVALPALTIAEDSGPSAAITVLANDSDIDGDTLTVAAASSPNGTVTINPDNTLSFTPAANFSGPATISYTISDGNGGTSTATVFVNVGAVNDAPVNSVPGAQSTNEDAPLAITGLSVADVDAASGNVTVTLAVTNGTLTVTGGTATIANSGTNSVTLTGTIAQINATLAANVSYVPTANFNGGSTLTMTSNDGGNTGSGGALSDTDTVAISVGAVNDAPVNTVPASITVTEDVATVITGISVGDVDAGASAISMTLSAASGTLAATTGSGVTISGSGSGSLVLNGTQAAINAFIAANNVSYTTAANASGSVVLTVTTNDNGNTGTGGALSDTDTITLNVAGVNDAPVNTVPGAQTTAEDTSLAITGLSVADVDAGSGSVTVTLGVTNGVLNVSGGTATIAGSGTGSVTLSGTIAQINATLGATVSYVPTANVSGSATLTMSTNDGGNSGSGGALSDTDTVTINITPVNDAPVASGAATLAAVAEDSANPPGATVASLFGANFSDTIDAATPALAGFAGIAARGQFVSANGRWQYSTDGGTSWQNFASLSDATATTLRTTDMLRFLPGTDFNGTPSNLTVRLIDSSTTVTAGATVNVGSNGGITPYSAATVALSTVISAVNDAPVNTVPGAQTTNEDTSLAITGLSVADVDAASGSITVTLAVTNGVINVSGGTATITNSGSSSVTLTGTLAQINATLAANVSYVPPANFNGASTLTMSTNDNGNTGGGALSDVDTVTINVSAVNDAPVNTVPGTQTTAEDTSLAITGLSIADVDAGSGSVTVTLAVTNGTLTVTGGTATIAGSGTGSVTLTGTLAQINATLAANVSYLPSANFTGASTLTMTTNDNGNSGGAALSDVDSVTINVTPVNDAPVNTVPAAQTTNEDTSLAITGLSIADVDAASGNVTVTLAVTNGTLAVTGGTAAISGSGSNSVTLTGSVAQINASLAANVSYVPTANFNGTATLTMSTNDGGNTGSGGALSDVDTVSITVNSINDTPVNTVPGAQTVFEDTRLAVSGVSVADPDDAGGVAAQRISTVQLSVSNGRLDVTLSGGATLSAGANNSGTLTLSGTQAAINATLATLGYTGNANYNGSDSLVVVTRDGLGLTDSDTIAFTVNPVNDAPSGTDRTITLNEDGFVQLARADFGFADAAGEGNSFLSVTVNAPSAGTLTLNGVTVAGPTVVTVAQLDSGLLRFTPAANANGSGYANFSFQVRDDGGTANGGVDTDPTPNTLTFNVTAVNDAPVNTVPGAQTTAEDTSRAITGLSIADVDAASGSVTVTLAVTNGTLTVSGGTATITNSGSNSVTLTGTITQINATLASNVSYVPTANFNGTATLTMSTNDNGNTGGAALSDVDTVTINVTAVNDSPVNTVPATQTTAEDTSRAITGLSIADVDAASGSVTVTLGVTNGTLTVTGGTATIAGSGSNSVTLTGTIAQINATLAATVSYVPSANFNGASTLTMTTNDGGNTGSGGALSDTDSVTINVTAVNDAPVNTVPGAQTTAEDTNLAITGLSVADIDAASGSVTVTLGVTNGTLTVTGGTATIAGSGSNSVTLTGTIAQINATLASNVSYVPSANFNGTSALTMTTNDGGNTGSGGALTDTDSVTINVSAVNDAPVIGAAAVTGTEDSARLFAWADFAVSDVDGGPGSLSITVASLPTDGTLQFDTTGTGTWAAIASGAVITQAQITANRLRFVPDPDESGVDGNVAGTGNVRADYASFTFTASDGGATSTPGTMRVDITPVADATTISAGANTLPASVGLTRTVHLNVVNLDGTSSLTLNNIEVAVEAQAISVANSGTVTGVSTALTNPAMGGDDAQRISGFVFLQAGSSYAFSGSFQDTLTLEIGGRRIFGAAYDGNNNDNETIGGASFVPAVSGYYSVEFISYNVGGGAGFIDLLVSVNGGAAQAFNSSNFNLQPTTAALTAVPDTVGAFVAAADTNTGANAALSVAGYYAQHGGSAVQGQPALLRTLTATYGDSADNSERHSITLDLSAAPLGTRVFVDANGDGAPDDGRIFTTSAGNTSVVVFNEDNPSAVVGGANWNLSAIVVDAPTNFTGSFNVNAISRAEELVNNVVVSTSSATQVLPVTLVAATNLAPDVGSASASVSEEGLSGGLADTSGTPDTTNATTASGTISITDTVDLVADSISSVTLAAPTTALTSGGVAVTWSGAGTGTLTASAGITPIATLTIDTAGAYTFTLLGAIDHPAANGENSLSLNFGVLASDGVNTGSGALTINIEDDQPNALAPITNFIAGTDTNLLITLDLSGSMNNASGIPGLTRLQAAIQSINTLLDRYDEFGAVAVRLVTFSDTATAQGASWLSVSAAKTLLAGLVASGATDYNDAIVAAQTAFATTTGRLANAQNVAYFLSDGAPTLGDEVTAAEETTWQNFLNANLIRSFAIGMGAGVPQAPMNPIAFNGQSNENTDAVVVAAFDDLDNALAGTIQAPPAGGLATGGAFSNGGQIGADGGYVATLTIEGSTYAYNPAGGGSISVTGTNNSSFDTATNTLTVTTASGGKFAIDMDDGSYRYSAPDSVPASFVENVAYTISDRDGDTRASSITVTVDRTNTIIGTTSSETLNGTAAPDYIVGRDGDDTLNGNANNDVLLGNNGNDILNGGDGNDRLNGGAGNDVLTGGLGADTFEWKFADRSTVVNSPAVDTIADFDSATPGAGGDILDLRDLLQGETASATLDRYLDFNLNGANTEIRISSSGGFTGGTYASAAEDQRIVLTNVDIRATLGLGVGATDSQIIAELINRGKLITDVPPGG